jgi:hypothetical protein
MHDIERFLHHAVQAGNFALQGFGVAGGLMGEGRHGDVDADEGLGDDVMQFAADALAFLLLGVQNLMGQLAEPLLLQLRMLEQLALELLTPVEGALHRLTAGDLAL